MYLTTNRAPQTFAERSWLTDRLATLRISWNSWIEKASFLANIHLFELYLGLPHAQFASSPNAQSIAEVNQASGTPLDHSDSGPSDIMQEISDAVDEVMDESDIATLDMDTSDSEEQQVVLSSDQANYMSPESLRSILDNPPPQASAASESSPSENLGADLDLLFYSSSPGIAALEQPTHISDPLVNADAFAVWDVPSVQNGQIWTW